MLKYILLFVTSLFSISSLIDGSFAGKLYETGGACVGIGSDSCSIVENTMHTYDSDFILTGKIITGTMFVGITENNDNEYILKKFNQDTGFFTYNISKKFGNLADGMNVYHVRFYDQNHKSLGKEQIYKVTFLDKEKRGNSVIREGKKPQNEGEEIEENIPTSIFYTQSDIINTYFLRLRKDFGNSTLDLGNGYSFVYTAFFNKNSKKGDDPWAAKAKITYSNPKLKKSVNSNEILGIDFSAYQFNRPNITRYSNNYFIIETGGGHEGVSNIFVFSPKTMKIYDLYKLEKKILGKDAYPVMNAVVKDGKVTISEFKYCCDTIDNPGGYEKIIIDIEKEKLVSREPIK